MIAAELSFDVFWDTVRDALVLPPGSIGPETSLQGDLGFDSLTMAELIVVLDELGAFVPETRMLGLERAADVYDLYRSHLVLRVGTGAP